MSLKGSHGGAQEAKYTTSCGEGDKLPGIFKLKKLLDKSKQNKALDMFIALNGFIDIQ